jgi:hypothetical protein
MTPLLVDVNLGGSTFVALGAIATEDFLVLLVLESDITFLVFENNNILTSGNREGGTCESNKHYEYD